VSSSVFNFMIHPHFQIWRPGAAMFVFNSFFEDMSLDSHRLPGISEQHGSMELKFTGHGAVVLGVMKVRSRSRES
jgi:hypothetical protein